MLNIITNRCLSFLYACTICLTSSHSIAVQQAPQKNSWFVAAPQNTTITLMRYHEDAVFSDSLGNDDHTTDEYILFPFYLDEPSSISVDISGLENKAKTFIPSAKLEKGSHLFVATFESVSKLLPQSTSFTLTMNGIEAGGTLVKLADFHGRMLSGVRSQSLGRILQHNVMIYDGKLSIRRDDVRFEGRGPQLTFIRTYTGQTPVRERPDILGSGWRHSHDIKITPIAYGATKTLNNIPDWVLKSEGTFIPFETVNNQSHYLRMLYVSNGGIFKKKDGKWYPQMGYHGRIRETADELVFHSKDGTKYHFPLPRHRSIPNPKLWFNRAQETPLIEGELALKAPLSTAVIKIQDRNNNSLKYQYIKTQQGPLLTRITDSTNRALDFLYDATTATNSTTSPLRLTSVSGPDGITLKFSYDSNGNLTRFQRDSFKEDYQYEYKPGTGPYGRLVKVIDANDNEHIYQYLPSQKSRLLTQQLSYLNQYDIISSVLYPDNSEARIVYPEDNSLERQVFDLNGNLTRYTLNKNGNPSAILEAAGTLKTYVWGPNEESSDLTLLKMTNHEKSTSYTYDNLGNFTSKTETSGRIENTRWSPLYSTIVFRDWGGDSHYSAELDSSGNVIKEIQADGSINNFEYNQFGELTKKIENGTEITSYTYDQWGLLKSKHAQQGETLFSHDIRGRLISVQKPDGTVKKKQYDNLDRIIWSSKSGEIETYQYDNNGNRIYQSIGAQEQWFEYDARDRVKVSKTQYHTTTYTYDANSNILKTESTGKVTRKSQYDAENRQVYPVIAQPLWGITSKTDDSDNQ